MKKLWDFGYLFLAKDAILTEQIGDSGKWEKIFRWQIEVESKIFVKICALKPLLMPFSGFWRVLRALVVRWSGLARGG